MADKCNVPTTSLRFIERAKLMEPPNEPHYVERQRCLQQMFWNLAGTVSEWRDVPVVQEDCTMTDWPQKNAEIERLRAALRFYAGPVGGDTFPHWADGYPGGVMVDWNIVDFGHTARAALTQEKQSDDQ
jgi:hypothetical protein